MKYFRITLFFFLSLIIFACSSKNGPTNSDSENDDKKTSNWKVIEGDYSGRLEHIFFIDNKNGFIAGSDGILLKTTDGGNTWNSVSNISNTANIQDINFVDKNNGYVTVYDSSDQLFKTTDGGETWSKVDTQIPYDDGDLKISPRTVYFYNSNLGFVGGSDGGLDWQGHFNIYKTNDGGKSWKGVQSGREGNPISNLHFASSNVGYAIRDGNNGTGVDATSLLRTTNGGSSWHEVFSEDYTTNVGPIYFIGSNTGFIGNIVSPEYSGYPNVGTIAKTTNGGSSWEIVLGKIEGIDVGLIYNFNFEESLGFAVGSNARIFKTVDTGNSWTEETLNKTEFPNEDAQLYDIKIINEDLAFAVGYPGIILKYEGPS